MLRDAYVDDCARAVRRWNKVLGDEQIDFRFALPSARFNRKIGLQATHFCDPAGTPLSKEEWETNKDKWTPTEQDKKYVRGIMARVTERGKFANWITPPNRGIFGKPLDFEYVRL